jgi:hypothetical protein
MNANFQKQQRVSLSVWNLRKQETNSPENRKNAIIEAAAKKTGIPIIESLLFGVAI